MDITFLSAEFPLVKRYTLDNGALQKSPYPNAYYFTSHTHEVKSLTEFHKLIVAAAKKGQCLLKGQIKRPLNNESRAGSTDSETFTQWICFDLDGARDLTPQSFMDAIGLSDVSYIVQYSASMGIEDKGLSAHIFVLLSAPVAAPFLKQWLLNLNLKHEFLRSQIRLTRTGAALRWPLDITCCQNDKLIYIAPPQLGPGIKDTFTGKRIDLVKRKLEHLPTNLISADIPQNKAQAKELLNSLRKEAGYSKLTDHQYKTKAGVSYLAKPGEAVITGIKQERGFVYLNLNGGDSWGYYHPENNAEYIYNFKGEPTYRTEELLPDYWQSLQKTRRPAAAEDEIEYFAIRDFKSDTFYNGYYNHNKDELVMARASNEARLRSFLKQHGQPVPDFWEDWNLIYDPDESVKYDRDKKQINLYNPSSFYELKRRKVAAIPPTIRRVLESAVGANKTLDHFLNWLAGIVQYRKAMRTAWVLHGFQGTGKGVLFHQIITPILGKSNAHSMLMGQLQQPYTGWLETSLVVFVDEVQLSKLLQSSTINANLKSWITDPVVDIRRMYRETYRAPNRANFIFASNQPDPVILEHTDRRFNVGEFQAERLELTGKEIANLADEIEDFFMYLAGLTVNLEQAATVLDSEDRQKLISINRTSVDEVADAILAGDMEYLIDQLPTSDDPIFATPQAAAYKHLLTQILERGPQSRNLTREELVIIFDYCIGGVPRSPNKFTAMLKHHRLHTKRVRRGDRLHYGIDVDWKQNDKWFEIMRQRFTAVPEGTKNVVSIKKAKIA